jgi:Flp pilus assembly protein CpaB
LKRSNRLILLIGIFLAIVAFIGIVLALQQPAPPGPPQAATTRNIVYATVDIPLGTQMTADMFKTEVKPITDAAADAIGDPGLLIGQVAREDIKAGAQMRQAFISGATGTLVQVATRIPLGLRAMAIQVDQVSGVGTLINAGDRVDLVGGLQNFPVVSIDPETDAPTPVAGLNQTSVKILVQNMLVVGALLPPQPQQEGQAAPPEGTALTGQQEIVIVAVTPQQAEVIKYAQLDASISLVLRSPKDFVDENNLPIEPAPDTTTGIILKTLVDFYGVLPPELIETVLPAQPTP